MEADKIQLTVVGEPGEEIQIRYRGDRETGEAPVVYTGNLGPDGRVTIPVPRAYLVLGGSARTGVTPLELHDEKESARTVHLMPRGKPEAGTASPA
jgi:hypothetical protein